jgi:hypothetical protein
LKYQKQSRQTWTYRGRERKETEKMVASDESPILHQHMLHHEEEDVETLPTTQWNVGLAIERCRTYLSTSVGAFQALEHE